MPNPVVRWQILSPDAEKTTAFYEKLFSWEASTTNGLGYRELRSEYAPRSISGGVWPAPQTERPFVQLFMEVEDIDESMRKAQKLGAAVLVPKSVLPDGDVMAVLQDPLGLAFGLCQLRVAGKKTSVLPVI